MGEEEAIAKRAKEVGWLIMYPESETCSTLQTRQPGWTHPVIQMSPE